MEKKTAEEFDQYIQSSRDEFVDAVNQLEWNTGFRTKCENLLIAYDQMKQKLHASQETRKEASGFTLKQENAIWEIIQHLAKEQFQNPRRVYKRKDIFDLIKAEMD